jgi:hypothetical protein
LGRLVAAEAVVGDDLCPFEGTETVGCPTVFRDGLAVAIETSFPFRNLDLS